LQIVLFYVKDRETEVNRWPYPYFSEIRMAQIAALIDTLKQALKNRHLTYAEIARQLDMSEANVKRMFSAKRFTLDRLEAVCALLQMEISDLVYLYEESRQRISHLTENQEQELVNDNKLLLVAVSVRNRLSFKDIIENYNLSDTECIQHLAKLDKLKIIDLLPQNRYKLRIDEDFRWLPGGPIEIMFEQQIKKQFLNTAFNKPSEYRLFSYGLLGETSMQILIQKSQQLASEYAELLRQDAKLPIAQRKNFGMMIAMRPWKVDLFEPFVRAKIGKKQ